MTPTANKHGRQRLVQNKGGETCFIQYLETSLDRKNDKIKIVQNYEI